MRSTIRIAAAALAALLLAGCTAPAAPVPGAPDTAAGSTATAPAVKTPAGAGTTPEPSPNGVDPARAKAAALADGRPEPAWDKNCVAWELPDAQDDGQAWANGLAATWLKDHGAGCPDAIVFPHYYVDSFAPGDPGELVVTLEDQAARDYVAVTSDRAGLKNMALDTFRGLYAEHRDLQAVTYTVEEGGATATVDREDWRKITAHWLWADPEFSDPLYTEIHGDLPADFSSEQAREYYEDFFGPIR